MGNSYVRRQQIKAMQSGQRASESEAALQRKRQQNDLQGLEDEIARLKLVCESMWELMSEVTGLTADQLSTRIREVDMDDGRIDGRKVHALADCYQCQAKIAHNSAICTYCGADAPERSPFAF